MEISREEIVFLNCIAKPSQNPFGVLARIKKNEDSKALASVAEDSLTAKGILEKGKGLTKDGYYFVDLWKKYCEAPKHVVIDDKIIGILPGSDCIVVVYKGDNYEVYHTDRVALFFGMLKSMEFMQQASLSPDEMLVADSVSFDDWENQIKGFAKGSFTCGIMDGKKLEESSFFWDEKECFRYDFNKKEQYRVTPQFLRMYLMKALNITKGELKRNYA